MKEWWMIGLLVAGPGLWMLGGKTWKGWRRFVWPVVAAIALLVSGVAWWKAGLVMVGLVAVNSLPYGDRTPWYGRVLTFLLYPLPIVILSASSAGLMMLLSAGTLSLWFWLSRRFNAFTWKIWESEAGLLQAAAVIVGSLS